MLLFWKSFTEKILKSILRWFSNQKGNSEFNQNNVNNVFAQKSEHKQMRIIFCENHFNKCVWLAATLYVFDDKSNGKILNEN